MITKCWQVCRETGPLIHCWQESKMVQPLWKTFWPFIVKLNMWLPCEPVITLWGIYPSEIKPYIYTKICIWMFPAALLIIAKHWKQSSPRVFNGWKVKWDIQTTSYNSAIRRNELLIHATAWIISRELCWVNKEIPRSHTLFSIFEWFPLWK